jgi:hypothetical protein
MLGQSFPPIVTQIPDESLVGELQDRKRLPLMASEAFTRGIQPLANALFSTNGKGASDQVTQRAGKGREIRLFGMKIRV